MKLFHCDQCGNRLHFENTACTQCGATLAYLPDQRRVAAVSQDDEGIWRPVGQENGNTRGYRLCANYCEHDVCNWAVDSADDNTLCRSCRMTRMIPDLSLPGRRTRWFELEKAKRRVLYNIEGIGLPLFPEDGDIPYSLVFEFMEDPIDQSGFHVMTGHDTGKITINLSEADDAERARCRETLGEPYRTLVGHMRHELGHYYWDLLISPTPAIESFRELFGDERMDYASALANYYANGAAPGWQSAYVSAYATAHPWEDWAESWAHYMHMIAVLETAADIGISLNGTQTEDPLTSPTRDFDSMVSQWLDVSFGLNCLNRSLGQADAYPFVLSSRAMEKLRYVHDLVQQARLTHLEHVEMSRAGGTPYENQSVQPVQPGQQEDAASQRDVAFDENFDEQTKALCDVEN